MTQQYLVGELSLRLAQLREVAGRPAFEQAVAQLRHEAEATGPELLARPLLAALALGDDLCWDSLARGDANAFRSQARVCADLREFGVRASLLGD
jgi:hypothetical protein